MYRRSRNPNGRKGMGKGRVSKIGESPYKRSQEEMSFKPRTIV